MPKKLRLAIVSTLLVTLLLGGKAMAGPEAVPVKLTTTGADSMTAAPIGLIIFGVASLGIGLIGYAMARRKSAQPYDTEKS
jgi:hypothetical protein